MTGWDVTALGEVLIDFTPCGMSENGMALFERNPGGAPANVLTALTRLGSRCAFIGKVGRDMHGAFLEKTLRDVGIDTRGFIRDPDAFTTLAFVALTEAGERSFSFARKPGADTRLAPGEVDTSLLSHSRVFHFGSLSLTDQPARNATWFALRTARQAGAVISYDPNYRPLLWPDEAAAREQMRSVLGLVDLLKISDEECALLSGQSEPEAAARALLAQGPSAVVVTLGAGGALAATHEGCVHIPAFPCQVVDTTGAGDSFWGGFLSRYLECGKAPRELTLADISGFARFGNAVASLCVEKRGAIPAMPDAAQVAQRMA